MQSKFQQSQEARNHIREGFRQMNEANQAKETEAKKENVVADVDFNEHREMTTEEKDKHLINLTDAVNQLTERLNKYEGGGE